MARNFFDNLPSTRTPVEASRMNGLLDGDEAMGNIIVDSVSSKNMFNENAILKGYELIGSGTYIGGLNPNSNWYVSDFIEVQPNQNYYLTKGSSGSSNLFYNSNKEYVDIVSASSGVITVPNNNNIKYMRFNGLLSQLSNVQFEKGTTATDYAPYQGLLDENNIKNKELVVGGIKTKNLFNQEILRGIDGWDMHNDYYNGPISSLYNYFSSDGIYTDFEANTQYTISCICYATTSGSNVRFKITYSDNTTEISSYFPINSAGQIIKTTTANKTVSKITFDYSTGTNVYIKSFQLEKGNVASNFSIYQELNIGYMEGTWTPTIDTLDGAPTVTYNSRSGNYTRIGNMVYISFVIKGKITALNGTNNYAIITGLPYWPKTGDLGLNPLSQGEVYASVSEWQSGVTYNVYRETISGVAKPTIHVMNISGTGTLKYIVTTASRFEMAGSGWYQIDTTL